MEGLAGLTLAALGVALLLLYLGRRDLRLRRGAPDLPDEWPDERLPYLQPRLTGVPPGGPPPARGSVRRRAVT